MKQLTLYVIVTLCHSFNRIVALPQLHRFVDDDEENARAFMEEEDRRFAEKCYEHTVVNWNYSTNINDINQELLLNASLEYSKFAKMSWQNRNSKFKSWPSFKDPDLKRKFKKLMDLGASVLPEDVLAQYNKLQSDMSKTQSTTKVCAYQNSTICNLSLDPDLKKIMKESRNEHELRHIWTEWHNKCGNRIRQPYEQFVKLSNQAAVLNNFSDTGDYWLREYESDTIKEDFEQIYETLAPLYKQIHAYARAKLRDEYKDQFSSDGLIPAHLFGSLFASSMDGIYSLLIPFPDRASIDVTKQLKAQGYTPLKMFQKADEFFTSLGLIPMPEEFWKESLIVKPKDREVACHATAWDFCNGKDFRIKQCTEVNMKDFITIHHEMGHIQYFLQYKDKPFTYRDGANPGFHEAVGDTLALSVQTLKHLKEVGLLDEATPIDDYETSINFLMAIALKKVASLPFAYIIDKYRLAIFDGSVDVSRYNSHWWELRKKYQGVKPPVQRSEENFDPGTIYHVASHVDYHRYFAATIIQFQFHRSLCKEAGQYDPRDPLKPLHNCSIYRSKAAGTKLATGLAMGASQPWPAVMKSMTSQEIMDASAIREYFKPLEDWLTVQNSVLGEAPGWPSKSVLASTDSPLRDHKVSHRSVLTVPSEMEWRVAAIISLWLIASAYSFPSVSDSLENDLESQSRVFLAEYDRQSSEKCFKAASANWNYATDIRDETEKIKLEQSLEYSKFQKEAWKNITNQFKVRDNFKDPALVRAFKKIAIIGTSASALPEERLKEFQQLKNTMAKIYSTAKTCAYEDATKCNLSLDPDLTKIMKESRDEAQLRHAWKEWHDKAGVPIRQHYKPYVDFSNEIAKTNSFSDAGAFWLREYESETIKEDIEQLWQTLKPFYQQMHAYVRAKLRDTYGGQITEDGLIPAHLLGNMWAQSWENIYSLVVPFPEKASIDVTEQMKEQGYTPLKMFQVSDEFFTSLGLIPMPPEFWKESLLEKPKDREVVCHASAWDFCNGKDFRIKQCTVVNTEDLITVHHEMGHVQYYLQYKDQPLIFRRGANPGFHEAVGDTLALSVITPKHLKEIGLLDESTPIDDYETSINFLLSMALEKIAFLPFGYLIDKYRWDIFDGTVEPSNYNAHWWKLRREYQGLKSPVERSEENFDAGAKYHVPADVEYLRYFVSKVIQFQFHRSLCLEAGQYDPQDPRKPLHNCDIYRSKAAGAKLAAGLAMGSSRPWPEVMKVMTGQEKMDASAIREYFKPLEDWLSLQNAKLAQTPGWQFLFCGTIANMKIWTLAIVAPLLICITNAWNLPSLRKSKNDLESEARSYLAELDRSSSQKCYESSVAEWAYATDINDENEKVKLEVSLNFAKFSKEIWQNATTAFPLWREFKDPDLVRKFKQITVLGAPALPDDQYKKYAQLETDMTKHYSTTKICSFKNKETCNLSLEPELTKIMAESRNEKELRHVWTEWHDKSGGPIKHKYKEFVEISNQAAKLNNFNDTGALWLHSYESETFKDDVEELWQTLKPLYQQIHAYVRAQLRNVYGDQFSGDGLIPAHLLGNMWAQSWKNIYSLMTPYPTKASIDVTEQMIEQGYTPLKMFQVSDEFFTSLGLIPMPDEFWKESMIEKPDNREVVCHASAWDFCNKKDFRIKQCTRVTANDLVVVHHEMGHIQYDLLYKDQPILYRNGANPGFHEAVGDTLALSVITPKHLKEIRLLDESIPIDDYETSINFLFSMALEKIAFLPFAYLIDKYRWDIYDGTVDEPQYNTHWWKLRKEYQGIKPPNARSEANFDAAAKFHVPANVEYLRYFVSTIIQFQFHRSLCIEAGQYDPLDPNKPLHNCDIYRSKAAGSKLAAGLSMGSSKPWPEVMKVMTGQEKMDASAIREYFKPLEKWLSAANEQSGKVPGWK
ncbi:angiotensin-converting enzyme-like [Daphnia carinata]|uniref:angiotensin-converting enzyme-like n=1 Tax=Daphnia carinata TaxID=120202 RepID=UPI002869775E|nr:angiotensin-converting enzyme-like [Daphnia carinata]